MIAALVSCEIILLALSAQHASHMPPAMSALAFAAGAFVPFIIVILLLSKTREVNRTMFIILAGAVCARILLLFFPMSLSDDAYRYVWDGRVLVSGTNPYEHPPAARELMQLRDEAWKKINHPDVGTVYPPFAQLYFALTVFLWPAVSAFRLWAAVFDMAVIAVIITAVNGSLKPPWNRRSTLAAAAYALCPVCIMETALAGHIEPLAGLLLVSGLVYAQKRKRISALMIALAGSVKLLPLVTWPVVSRRVRSSWIAVPLITLALYLPFSGAGFGMFEGTDAMARRWRNNEGVFRVLEKAAAGVLAAVDPEAVKNGFVHFKWLDNTAAGLENGFFDLHKSRTQQSTLLPGAFTVQDFSAAVAKLAGVIMITALMIFFTVRKTQPIKAGAFLMCAVVMLLPVIHPWYLLLFAPLMAAAGYYSWLWLAFTMPFSYLALDGWLTSAVWEIPAWVQPVEYVPFFTFLIIEILLREKRRNSV